MKCPECVKAGQRSEVYDLGSSTTLMGVHAYYDENGQHHYHDPNKTTTGYRCSKGHEWSDTTRNFCWCERNLKRYE
jgi:hypothetical protein